MDPESNPKSEEPETPLVKFQRELNGTTKALNMKGYLTVRYIARERNEDSEEDGSEEDEPKFSEKELSTMRFFLINDDRSKLLDTALNFASNGQHNEDFQMYTTTDGNNVCLKLESEVKKAMRKKTKPDRINSLFALTHSLMTYDHWIEDNECWGEGGEVDTALQSLAKAWKTLLKESDATLGIDSKYSRPALIALLEDFEEFIAEHSDGEYKPYTFQWK